MTTRREYNDFFYKWMNEDQSKKYIHGHISLIDEDKEPSFDKVKELVVETHGHSYSIHPNYYSYVCVLIRRDQIDAFYKEMIKEWKYAPVRMFVRLPDEDENHQVMLAVFLDCKHESSSYKCVNYVKEIDGDLLVYAMDMSSVRNFDFVKDEGKAKRKEALCYLLGRMPETSFFKKGKEWNGIYEIAHNELLFYLSVM